MKDWLFRIAACSAITLSSLVAAKAEPLDVIATFSIIGDFAAAGDEIFGEVVPERRRHDLATLSGMCGSCR